MSRVGARREREGTIPRATAVPRLAKPARHAGYAPGAHRSIGGCRRSGEAASLRRAGPASPQRRRRGGGLPALPPLRALATGAFAADLVPCLGGDADCDDGDVCTLDTCGGSDGCRHDPVGLDAVRAAIDQALAVDACAEASVPPIVVTLRQRAATLIDR